MYERNFFLLNIILCDCERYVLRFLWFVCYLFGMYIYMVNFVLFYVFLVNDFVLILDEIIKKIIVIKICMNEE